MTLSTRFTDAFGVAHPVAQAPVGSVTCPDLAATVSSAGGLGSLAVTWHSPEATERAIEETRSSTDAPFAVNLVLDDATTRYPTDEQLAACLDAGAPVVAFSFGDPAPYVERVHEAGALAVTMVGTPADARSAAEAGVDAVVAQGAEAGGHLDSETSTLALVPRVVDAVDVPVLAAGGIVDGRGVAAALALGADGAYLGTRFVATAEALSHPAYRDRLLDADGTETVRTDCFDGGWPGRDHRVLRNSTVEEWEAAGRSPRGERPNEGEVVARVGEYDVERYDDDPPLSATEGDVEAMALYAGQGVGAIEDVPSASAVVGRLVTEAETAVERLSED
ncbi:NAD(P)H-dependent flavin oxidoreductase [Halomarina oriensis]|uniref:Nitronate monooxygenase n=1 Tax=Halomarina oriensis TaxID=671145 RepID=A0A6B0GL40_9EURY|nr:nitronate monooxygenase [Halomarina oriensis]MWG35646.1 nitronate monooxygenase [Halomarina oriensis]